MKAVQATERRALVILPMATAPIVSRGVERRAAATGSDAMESIGVESIRLVRLAGFRF